MEFRDWVALGESLNGSLQSTPLQSALEVMELFRHVATVTTKYASAPLTEAMI